MRELAIVVAIAWTIAGIPSAALGAAIGFAEGMRLAEEAARTGALPTEDLRQIIFATMGSPLILIASGLSDTIITLTAIWYFACRQLGRSFFEGVGLQRSRWTVPAALIGLLLATGASFVPDQQNSGIHAMTQSPGGFYTFLALALVIPLVEEVYYRGFLFPILSRRFGAMVAFPVIVLWFTAIHVPQLAPQWVLIAYIGLVSIVLTALRHLTGSLLPALVTHLTYNAALVVMALVARFSSSVPTA